MDSPSLSLPTGWQGDHGWFSTGSKSTDDVILGEKPIPELFGSEWESISQAGKRVHHYPTLTNSEIGPLLGPTNLAWNISDGGAPFGK